MLNGECDATHDNRWTYLVHCLLLSSYIILEIERYNERFENFDYVYFFGGGRVRYENINFFSNCKILEYH